MAAAGKLGRWKYWAKHFHLKLRQHNQATLVSSSSSSSLHLPLGLPAPVASQRYKLGWDWIWARQIHTARRAALLTRARWHQRCRHGCQSCPSFHEGVKVKWDPSRRSCDRNASHFGDWHSSLQGAKWGCEGCGHREGVGTGGLHSSSCISSQDGPLWGCGLTYWHSCGGVRIINFLLHTNQFILQRRWWIHKRLDVLGRPLSGWTEPATCFMCFQEELELLFLHLQLLDLLLQTLLLLFQTLSLLQ